MRSAPTTTACTLTTRDQPRRRAVDDHLVRDAFPRQLPRRQPRALQQRPRLVDEHADPLALPVRRLHHAQRASDAARRQRAGVAVRQHRRAIVDQRRAQLAAPHVGRDLLLVDAHGLRFRSRSVAAGCREHAIDRPAQVHRRRPRRRQLVGGGRHVVAAPRGQREAVRGGDADQRRAAHRQPPDRVRHIAIVARLDVALLSGQQRLVEDAQHAVAPLDGLYLGAGSSGQRKFSAGMVEKPVFSLISLARASRIWHPPSRVAGLRRADPSTTLDKSQYSVVAAL